MTFRSRSPWLFSFGALVLLVAAQLAYFIPIIQAESTQPSGDFDLVLTYSDLSNMDPALDLALAHSKPLFISQAPWEPNPFTNRPPGNLRNVFIDSFAKTTDWNARDAARFIKRGGYKRVVLDVAWFHVPRALFLTRLYLLGSGVEVIPCTKTPVPQRWWADRLFHIELFKFWGSLGRVALAAVGWETGPNEPSKNTSSKF